MAMYEEETQGQRLKRLREALELTQKELAHRAGLSGQSMQSEARKTLEEVFPKTN